LPKSSISHKQTQSIVPKTTRTSLQCLISDPVDGKKGSKSERIKNSLIKERFAKGY
jgi:hypothetical protein